MENCEQLELDLVFEKIEQESPKNKEYSLQVVYANGRVTNPISEYPSLDKIKAVADILYEQGGYVFICSDYKLGGYSPARVHNVEYFKGSEQVFEQEQGRTLASYIEFCKQDKEYSKKLLKNYMKDLAEDGLLNEWLELIANNGVKIQ